MPVPTPLYLLETAKAIFAASHWTRGTFTEVVDDFDDGKQEWKTKPRGCSVGGLRYAALAPMEHALDETWMVAHFASLGDSPVAQSPRVPAAHRDATTRAYIEALDVLAKAVDEQRHEELDPDLDGIGLVEELEEIIIGWNDSFDFASDEERITLVEEEILPVFNSAIDQLKGATA